MTATASRFNAYAAPGRIHDLDARAAAVKAEQVGHLRVDPRDECLRDAIGADGFGHAEPVKAGSPAIGLREIVQPYIREWKAIRARWEAAR